MEEMIISDPFLPLGTSQIAVLFRLEDKEQELLSLDKAFLNKVIRGEVDFMATDFGEIFIAVAERYDGKGGEMEQLVRRVANTSLENLSPVQYKTQYLT